MSATGLDAAAGEPDPRVVELAHQVLALARTGETALLTQALDVGVPRDLSDPQGNSLLMLAAYHGHAAATRLLAERGADVDRLNDRGQSPLAGAVFKGEDEVVRVLLTHGADPDLGTPSARDAAVVFGRPELVPPPDDPTGPPPGTNHA
ncbi:MAG: ankyrin repeat domain-containing protein [Nocardioides sp.]|nr:ankyrin repeat domain-containing protein [Nocardioides sp.]